MRGGARNPSHEHGLRMRGYSLELKRTDPWSWATTARLRCADCCAAENKVKPGTQKPGRMFFFSQLSQRKKRHPYCCVSYCNPCFTYMLTCLHGPWISSMLRRQQDRGLFKEPPPTPCAARSRSRTSITRLPAILKRNGGRSSSVL